MSAKNKPTSPLFGWMAAGVDMLSAQVEQVTGMVSKQLDATHALFEELQARGASVDKEMRDSFNASSVMSSLQTMMMANPLISLVPGAKKAQIKEQQLEALSAKVDLLVEQVALLAAKKAASKKARPASAKAESETNTNTTSSASPVAKKPATRTKTTASKSATATKRATGSSSAGKKRPSRTTQTTAKPSNN